MTVTRDHGDVELSLITPGRRLTMLAQRHPSAPAVIFATASGAERVVTWAELEATSNRVARALEGRGVEQGSTVVVALPTGPDHVVTTLAAWKLGAMVLPLNARMPAAERQAVLEVASPTLVVADWEVADVTPADLAATDDVAEDPLPDRVPNPGKAIASGGSTGRPKIIVDPTPFEWSPALLAESARAWSGMGEREVQLVVGPFYHNLPFSWAHLGLFLDHHLVVMERFDAARALDLVERHRVTFVPLVPTMMRRMLLVPDVHQRDLSSLKAVFHTAAPCPEPVKRGWIELVGPERVYELYGATEATGTCMIRGDEWLAHPGSVGRPSADTEVRILDESRRDVPVGEVGEVFMRRLSGVATYRYVGSPPAATTDEGFVSVGDLGRLDEDGYLYLADRRADLVITGGANVYPAEVEAALIAHPGVLDVVVIGLPSEEWGRTVHAVVQPVDPAAPPSEEELARHCRERLTPYKVPKSFELVAELPRNEAGKVRRSALAAERAAQA